MELDFEKPVLEIEAKIKELMEISKRKGRDYFVTEIAELQSKRNTLLKEIYSKLTAWQIVQIARHPDRPVFSDYVENIFTEFIELHGDRCFGDDKALRGGFATIGDCKVMVIGTDKGRNVEEKVYRNFGMARPEGYRKALRLMYLAEKFKLPVVSIIDTPAAYPGKDAEERGQAEAIARNLMEMSAIETPIVVVVTGEGGSGGAIGIGVGDVILMLSYSIYSVIPPEGCGAILWRDSAKAPEAAEALKLTASSLYELGVIDEIIPEPIGGAHRFKQETFENVRKYILKHLKRLKDISPAKLVGERMEKYNRIGKFDNRRYAKH